MNKRVLFPLAAVGVVPVGAALIYFGSTARGAAAKPAQNTQVARATPAPTLPTAENAPAVVEAANAFLATLSEKQRATVQSDLAPRQAARWSNLPVTFVPRNGVYFRDLNPTQTAAALKVARLALSADGYQRFQEVRAADDLLAKSDNGPGGTGGPPPGGFGGPPPGGFGGPPPDGADGPPGGFGGPPPGGRQGGRGGRSGGPGGPGLEYGAGDYTIAFLGKPSKTAPWLLQLGGHHLAFNLYYKGAASAATPYFLGVEPTSWTDSSGKTHTPLAPMHDAMYGLVHSLTPDQQSQAHLSASFRDVLVGPGRDSHFPNREGVSVSSLSPTAQKFVLQAISAWSGDNAQAAQYRKLYQAELNQTKVAYSGATSLKNEGDYVRIDGPHVWIELACQGGIVFRNQIHYHTIWRDRVTDYGAEFSF